MLLSRRRFLKATLTALPAASFASEADQNWPAFRGLGGSGVADGFPTLITWNADQAAGKVSGLLWRTTLPGLGHSSPVVWGTRIFLCTAVRLSGKAPLRIGSYGDTKAAQDNDEHQWMVLCFDKKSGRQIWQQIVRTAKPFATRHEKATHANTTLATDGQRLIGFFGSEGLYCLDMYSELILSSETGNHWWASASSERRIGAGTTRARRAILSA